MDPPGDSITTLMFRVCSEPLISERRSQQSSGGGSRLARTWACLPRRQREHVGSKNEPYRIIGESRESPFGGVGRRFPNQPTYMTRIPLVPMLIAVVTVFFVIHYLFASITAQTTALLPVFLLAVLSLPGVPAMAVTLVLVYSLGLMGVLTPYASGPAPIWYSSGYVPTKDFWRLGATMGALYLAVLLELGLPFAINFLRF